AGDALIYDSTEGGAGSEEYVCYSYNKGLGHIDVIDLANSDVQDTRGAGHIKINTVENLEGGAKDDTLFGNDSENTLIGREGSDVFAGRDGDDTFIGGKATIVNGVVTANEDNENDTATYLDVNGQISVNMNVAGENDATLNIGKVINDGYNNV
ncbi:hypothetical protein CKA56_16540, partial [Arcobacter venerupis]|uniref:hypothetical protein n=1 Tax=Arcobacter venerupis TaxID=1054033 RepID=UPI001007F8C2